jgi:hypothetical protein
MIMLFRNSSNPRSYRIHARVMGRDLPIGEKALRLRCTLSTANHGIVGVSTLMIGLGAGSRCEQVLELIHEARDNEPPVAFELTLSISPQAAPHTRIPLQRDGIAVDLDPYHYRLSGVVDPVQGRISLPDIVLVGA